jgi:3,4-dihydroxy 2-butanone 4-phosphate synthase/GTP cyclohydrolase II
MAALTSGPGEPGPAADGVADLPHVAAVRRAVEVLAGGGMVVVIDDADRENEGDLLVAADAATSEQVAFIVRFSTGILCAAMPSDRADRLALPAMVPDNTDPHHTAFTITVDHVTTSTGVSAADRARTLRALADDCARPAQFRRPGHVFPLRAREGGVLKRAGHTEAAVDLLRLAGRTPVGVISEIVAPDGEMARGAQLRAFAAEHGMPIVPIADLIQYRSSTERLVEPTATARIPTRYGDFRATAYLSKLDGMEHLALTMGEVDLAGRSKRGVLIRVHSECLTGDVVGSLRCDCGAQFDQALERIAAEGVGALVYLRGHEGRGIGLAHKLRAYELQERGRDTVDANRELGLPDDSREYGIGAQILVDLGVRRMRLMTNNPAKYGGLSGHGLTIVERVALPAAVTAHNLNYLITKRDRMGHLIDVGESAPPLASSQ